MPSVGESSLLRGIREGRQADGRLRIVFDLTAPAEAGGGVFIEETESGAYSLELTLSAEPTPELSGTAGLAVSEEASEVLAATATAAR